MNAIEVSQKSLQAGTMMLQEGLLLPKLQGMETDAYSRRWRSVRALGSFCLGSKLTAVGLHLFFVVGQVTSVAFGRGREKSIRKAVQRIGAKVAALGLNCFELTEVRRKHFLGVPYIAISAHTYHIQQGCQLQTLEERRALAAQ